MHITKSPKSQICGSEVSGQRVYILHHQIQFLDAEMFRIKIYFNDKMYISNAIFRNQNYQMHTSTAKKGISKFYWLKNPYPQFEERINVISNAGFEFVMSVFHFSQIFLKSHQVNKMCISDRILHTSNAKKVF